MKTFFPRADRVLDDAPEPARRDLARSTHLPVSQPVIGPYVAAIVRQIRALDAPVRSCAYPSCPRRAAAERPLCEVCDGR